MAVNRTSSYVTLTINTNTIVTQLTDVESQRMWEATQVVRNTVLETLSGSRTGRMYRVPGTKTMYRASAPGEPPASATGDLRRRILTRIVRDGRVLRGYVGSPLMKARWLEWGTSRMEPRPFLRPSFQASLPEVRRVLARPWN